MNWVSVQRRCVTVRSRCCFAVFSLIQITLSIGTTLLPVWERPLTQQYERCLGVFLYMRYATGSTLELWQHFFKS